MKRRGHMRISFRGRFAEASNAHRAHDALGCTVFRAFDPFGKVAASNAVAAVAYAHTPDRLDSGYSLTLSNGVLFTRCLARDGYRRSLVTDISAAANGAGVGNLAYTYDVLNRPTARNADTFGYNARGEVTAANISGVPAAYGYDEIGNSTSWTANCLLGSLKNVSIPHLSRQVSATVRADHLRPFARICVVLFGVGRTGS